MLKKESQAKGSRLHKIVLFIFLIVLVAGSILLFSYADQAGRGDIPTIYLEAEPQTMIQDQAEPTLSVNVSFDDQDMSTILDEKSGYTIANLIEEMKEGKDYHVTCESDFETEGSYPIIVTVDNSLIKKTQNEWFGKIQVAAINSKLEVKNKYGTWDGNKFKGIDSGDYLKNQFITYKKKIYYLGSDGVKVTGWKTISGKVYHFNKKGVADIGWYEDGDSKYHFTKDGSASVGWYEEKDAKYYFAEDGKMLTGKQKLLTMICEFDKDGKLVSAKSTIDPNKPMVALTFDDGPGKDTARLLDALEKYDAHATFFMLGNNVPKYPDEVKRMKKLGCELGNHSRDHALLTTLSTKKIAAEVDDTNAAIKKITGSNATVMRPPYGGVDSKVKKTIQMPLIFWSVDTLDWKTKNAKKTVKAIMKNSEDGDIILLHDIHDFSVDAAIEAIPKLLDKGYQLVTVSEMAEAKGVNMKNGEKYFSIQKGDK